MTLYRCFIFGDEQQMLDFLHINEHKMHIYLLGRACSNIYRHGAVVFISYKYKWNL